MSQNKAEQLAHDEFDELATGEMSDHESHDVDKSAIASEHASKQVSRLQDQIKEERFLFAMAAIVLLNFILLRDMANWAAVLVAGMLQIPPIALFARKCGVEEVQIWLDKALSAFQRNRE